MKQTATAHIQSLKNRIASKQHSHKQRAGLERELVLAVMKQIQRENRQDKRRVAA